MPSRNCSCPSPWQETDCFLPPFCAICFLTIETFLKGDRNSGPEKNTHKSDKEDQIDLKAETEYV